MTDARYGEADRQQDAADEREAVLLATLAAPLAAAYLLSKDPNNYIEDALSDAEDLLDGARYWVAQRRKGEDPTRSMRDALAAQEAADMGGCQCSPAADAPPARAVGGGR